MLQGTLQGIYEYQTLAARLLGMEVATASHYDGATALAEALLMAVRITGRKKAALSRAIHPHYRQVVRTYFAPTGYELVEIPFLETGLTDLARLEEMRGSGRRRRAVAELLRLHRRPPGGGGAGACRRRAPGGRPSPRRWPSGS